MLDESKIIPSVPSGVTLARSKQNIALHLALGMAAVFVYCLPYFVLGTNVHIREHDVLDVFPLAFTQIYHSKTNPLYTSAAERDVRLFNGHYNQGLGPNFELYYLPFYFLDPFDAYKITQVLFRLCAYFGMFLFLGMVWKYFGFRELSIRNISSILFALMPHFLPMPFNVPGLPLLAWALLTATRNPRSVGAWLVIAAIPFFTFFLITPVFLLFLLGMGGIWYSIRRKKFCWRFFNILAIQTMVFIIASYQYVVSAFLHCDYVSHRTEFNIHSSTSFIASLTNTVENFARGQSHVATYHQYLLILIIPFIAVLCSHLARRLLAKNAEHSHVTSRLNKLEDSILVLLLMIALISLLKGYYYWKPIMEARELLGVFNLVQWDRFHWLHPFLWCTTFALLALWVATFYRRTKPIVLTTLILYAVLLTSKAEYFTSMHKGTPSFGKFYAKAQFSQIKSYIGKPQSSYRVVSLGIHPSIALFNGFYCLDGYHLDYDLNYKKRFRKVIACELGQSPVIKRYFDDYGSRCYFFSHELNLDYMCTKDRARSITSFCLNISEFTKLGGEYVISAVRIKDPALSGLQLLQIFDNSDSAWRIYLYGINDTLTSLNSQGYGT